MIAALRLASAAVAPVLCSNEFATRHGIGGGVTIAAQAMTIDYASSFAPVSVSVSLSLSVIKMIGYDLTRRAAAQVYEKAGIGPDEADVVEPHDCVTVNEVLSYEALGLCAEGAAERMIADDNTYGGRYVVNPSGGLLSKGHPLGATGLAQCTELVTQLRGRAGVRQVDGARIALQHNLGLGGACVVTLYRRD
ncbi:MAG: hypothetical protein ABW187_02300 [Dokdonella sp.]